MSDDTQHDFHDDEKDDFDPKLNCRMYEEKYPNADDLVVVQVKHVAEMGAYVSLLEYEGIEGMILLSELSRRRIRSINKLIRVGKQEVVVVVRVDREKGYIDLSKRRVSPEDIERAEEKFTKSKAVHSIIRHVAATVKNVTPLELYQQFGWDLYKTYGHAYDAFRVAVTQFDKVMGKYNLRDDIKTALFKIISRRLTPQPIKLRADVEVTCFGYDGIDAIKDALKAGEAAGSAEIPIKIKLVAPPLYVLMTQSMSKEQGTETLNHGIEAITKVIKSRQGDINVKQAPFAVSERDDKLLQTMMETLEKQNTEVAGDEPTDD